MKRHLLGTLLLPFFFTLAQGQTNAPSAVSHEATKINTPLLDFENADALHLPPDGFAAGDFEGKIYVVGTDLHYNTDPVGLAPGSKQSLRVLSHFDDSNPPKQPHHQFKFEELNGRLAVDGFKLWAKFIPTQDAREKLEMKVGGDGVESFATFIDVPHGGGWIEIGAKDFVSIDWSKPGHPATPMSSLSKASRASFSWIDFSYRHKGDDQFLYLDKMQTYTYANAPAAPAPAPAAK